MHSLMRALFHLLQEDKNMTPLLFYMDWYRFFTNPTMSDFLWIGGFLSVMALAMLAALISDKIDEINDKKMMGQPFFKETVNNDFMFLTGEHK